MEECCEPLQSFAAPTEVPVLPKVGDLCMIFANKVLSNVRQVKNRKLKYSCLIKLFGSCSCKSDPSVAARYSWEPSVRPELTHSHLKHRWFIAPFRWINSEHDCSNEKWQRFITPSWGIPASFGPLYHIWQHDFLTEMFVSGVSCSFCEVLYERWRF